MTQQTPEAPPKIDNLIAFMNGPEVRGKQFLLAGDLHATVRAKRALTSLPLAMGAEAAGKKYLFHEIPVTQLWKFRAAQRGSWVIHKFSQPLHRIGVSLNILQAVFKAIHRRRVRKWVRSQRSEFMSKKDMGAYADAIVEVSRRAGPSGFMIVPGDLPISRYTAPANPELIGLSLRGLLDLRKRVEGNEPLAQAAEELFGSKEWWTEPFEKHGTQHPHWKNKTVAGLLAGHLTGEVDSTMEFDIGQNIRTLAQGQGGTISFGDFHLNLRMIEGLGGKDNVALLSVFESIDDARPGLMMRAIRGMPRSHAYILEEDRILAPEEYGRL